MTTLLVNCYPDGRQDKLPAYIRLLAPFGPVWTANPDDFGSRTAGADAVVLTGSPIMLTRQPPPPDLAETLLNLTLPIFGICFGHQLLGIITGARLKLGGFYQAPGLVRVRRPDPLFTGMPERLVVFQSHAESVDAESAVATGWEILADSKHCPVEAFCHRQRPWYGVQFHPELSGRVGLAVLRNFHQQVTAVKTPART